MELAQHAVALLDGKKAEDLVLLDVRGLSTVTDFFLVATGNSAPHLKALAEELAVELKRSGVPTFRQSGDPQSGWMVLDYIDVVVHVFTPELRSYYALERLWKDAPRVEPLAAGRSH